MLIRARRVRDLARKSSGNGSKAARVALRKRLFSAPQDNSDTVTVERKISGRCGRSLGARGLRT